ncbi:factor-independent urate hydroxylase [Tengunoibacter tsumagoiensis]|uniref:Uricase n=1 Tax=Tengunoibacter tsumagoiensis TaxID=2014871 RepID=A0A402A144_9CHLR|nr:urate oxidase [Tengunoibacter tsumagoiensis]GCE12843.1 hypothetical protein KTT_27020 [Tengunoibacter tsumagoiensis]
MSQEPTYAISYGKMHVPVYRVYAQPLAGIQPIPESLFTSRSNTLWAFEVDVEVFGQNFLPAYTEGDNSAVVATDSMKNFVLREALDYTGSTLEDFLYVLGQHFLDTYEQMERLQLTARELPFSLVPVPQRGYASFTESGILFRRTHDDYAVAELSFERSERGPVVTFQRSGRVGLELLKVTGSSFTRFVQDEYTTLPERVDRPLFVYLDVHWKYAHHEDFVGRDLARYVAAEQVRDVVQVVFHEFVSESIQHLVHEIGLRLFQRYPQICELSFAAQNRTRDQISVSESDEKIRVYSDPFSAYGLIKLTLQREVRMTEEV